MRTPAPDARAFASAYWRERAKCAAGGRDDRETDALAWLFSPRTGSPLLAGTASQSSTARRLILATGFHTELAQSPGPRLDSARRVDQLGWKLQTLGAAPSWWCPGDRVLLAGHSGP